MSTIPIRVTEEQFEQPIRPNLHTAQRGYEGKIALYKVLNYMLYRLHSGCQWAQVPIAADEQHPEKKKSVGKRSTIIFRKGAPMGVWNACGLPAAQTRQNQ